MEGSVYPPSDAARLLSNIAFFMRLLLIGLLLGGPETLQKVGIDNPPQWFLWMCENKVNIFSITVLTCCYIDDFNSTGDCSRGTN